MFGYGFSASGFTDPGLAPGLLDFYPATAAYSLRKLRHDYTGAAIRVRRDSDNAEQDIGFSGLDLDTSALTSFCTGTNGFVVTWYDQAGSNNLAQATAANQPIIYNSATGVVIDNGKPVLDSRPDRFLTATPFTGGQYDSTFAVGKSFGDGGGSQFMHDGNTVNNMSVLLSDTGAFRLWSGSAMSTPTIYSIGTQYLVSAIANNAGTDLIAVNGAATTGNSGSNTRNGLMLFGTAAYGGDRWEGYIHEFILYSSDQSANRTAIESNINSHYNIYS